MNKLENKLFSVVAYDWVGDGNNDAPPLSNDTLKLPIGESKDSNDAHVISLLNDAHEVWFGFPDKWLFFVSRKDFHRIVRWYVKRYIFGEWLGMRRMLYYKLLSRRVPK